MNSAMRRLERRRERAAGLRYVVRFSTEFIALTVVLGAALWGIMR